MRNGAREYEWRHALEARGGFWEIWKSQLSWVESCLGRRRLTFACSWRPWAGIARDEGRWKSQNRKNVYLSPYVEEPLNSKVIKSFVPELRSRKCFSCFEIPMFYVYIYKNIICPFRISVSGYGTTVPFLFDFHYLHFVFCICHESLKIQNDFLGSFSIWFCWDNVLLCGLGSFSHTFYMSDFLSAHSVVSIFRVWGMYCSTDSRH